MKTFADRLNAAADATRETTGEIARSTSIPLKRVAELRSGAEPREHEAGKLAEFFDCDVLWLLKGHTPRSSPLLMRELELASVDAVGGVVTLQPDDYRRIYTLACMGRA
jgi:hypothetical protein